MTSRIFNPYLSGLFVALYSAKSYYVYTVSKSLIRWRRHLWMSPFRDSCPKWSRENPLYIFSESRDFWPRISCCLYENAEDWKCWAFQERKYLLIQNKTIWRLLPFSFYFYRILSYSTFLYIFSSINR